MLIVSRCPGPRQSDEHIQTSSFGRIEKAAIFHTRQHCESSRLTIMIRKKEREPLVATA
jgi:hypothetical protein